MNKMSKSSSNMQDELKDSIYQVSMSITELDSALTHIDHKINDLFRFLIWSRVALLNNLSILSSWLDQGMALRFQGNGCSMCWKPISNTHASYPHGITPISLGIWHFRRTVLIIFSYGYMTVTYTFIHTDQTKVKCFFYWIFLWLKFECLNFLSFLAGIYLTWFILDQNDFNYYICIYIFR